MEIPSDCKFWYSPDSASSDYFNVCSPHSIISANVPDNFCGWQYARTGDAYAGIALRGTISLPDAREYIQTKLDSLLIYNHKYCIEFYVSFGQTFNQAANNIGMYISDTAPTAHPYLIHNFFNLHPQINTATPITDTANWVLVSGMYIAHGGEQYITIGNFYPDSLTDTVYVSHQPGGDGSYYYIDDVSLIDCTNQGLGIDEESENGNNITISPNPCTSQFTAHSEGMKIKSITIKNLFGQQIKTANTETIDITDLPNGLYIAEIKTEKRIVRKKIIKQ